MLNSKQVRYLWSLSNKLKPIIHIGKDGISDNLFNSIDDAFNTHELVKAKILKSCEDSANSLIINISSNCHCECIEHIGNILVFYKRNKNPKIFL